MSSFCYDPKAGDLLFEIDPRPYQIVLSQARAALETTESQLEQSRALDVARYKPLAARGAVSQQELDNAVQNNLANLASVGLASYYEVLEAQQRLYPAQNAQAQIRLGRLAADVQLYKALGGGWNLKDPQQPPSTAEAQEPAACADKKC